MKNPDFSKLPTWLPRQIKRIGLRKEQFAHRVGVSRTTIYRYIYDMDRPTEDTMLKMCRVLDIPFEEGLRQYVPKKNGRPAGGGETFVKARTRR
jgi:transcriptional regulator with XRE-family HTH domain